MCSWFRRGGPVADVAGALVRARTQDAGAEASLAGDRGVDKVGHESGTYFWVNELAQMLEQAGWPEYSHG